MEKLSQYIFKKDFECKCGCGLIKPDWIELIIPDYKDFQNILFGVYDLVAGRWEAKITSGYRCPKWNEKIGGAKYSPHTFGLAIDFIVNMQVRREVIEYLKYLQKHTKMRIGHKKYNPTPGHIHIDVMPIVAIELYTAQKIPLQVFSAYTNVKEW